MSESIKENNKIARRIKRFRFPLAAAAALALAARHKKPLLPPIDDYTEFLSETACQVLKEQTAEAWKELQELYQPELFEAYVKFMMQCTSRSGYAPVLHLIIKPRKGETVFISDKVSYLDTRTRGMHLVWYTCQKEIQAEAEWYYRIFHSNSLTVDESNFDISQKYDHVLLNANAMAASDAVPTVLYAQASAWLSEHVPLSSNMQFWILAASALLCLKEQGTAAVILPKSELYAENSIKIRTFFAESGFLKAVFADVGHRRNSAVLLLSRGNKKTLFSREIPRQQVTGTETKIETIREHGYSLSPDDYVPKDDSRAFLSNLMKTGTRMTRGILVSADRLLSERPAKKTPVRVILMSDITDGMIQEENASYLPEDARELDLKTKLCCVPSGTLLITKSKPFRTAVAEVPENTEFLISSNLYLLPLDEKQVNPFYVQAYLESEPVRKMLLEKPESFLSLTDLSSIVIPLLPMEQQNRIADQWKEHLRKLRKTNMKLRKLRAESETIFTDVSGISAKK